MLMDHVPVCFVMVMRAYPRWNRCSGLLEGGATFILSQLPVKGGSRSKRRKDRAFTFNLVLRNPVRYKRLLLLYKNLAGLVQVRMTFVVDTGN